ncbi:hypothetical protein [Cellvibrio sp. OA-2007]|uniref:hypothetical protein n=1 Tax=Cellvibrio sp. OA-2007 TaxID=529823 RepID=UPI00078339EB|nr:hypothetical protein [Cellvibrio sp. OA-2007]
MKVELFNQYALYWAGGFLVVYVLAQLLVSKHSRFQFLSAIQKSLLVKLIAISAFALTYVFVQVVAG